MWELNTKPRDTRSLFIQMVKMFNFGWDNALEQGAVAGKNMTGLEVMVNDIYRAEIRGLGKSTTTVRFFNSKVYSMGDGIDLLVGMAAKESITEVKDVKPGGGIIYDTSTPRDVTKEESLAAHIPSEANGRYRAKVVKRISAEVY